MPPPSLSPEKAKVAKFYSARSKTIPPLPWQTFALPFSELAPDERTFKIARRLRRYKDSYRHQGRNLTPHSLEAPPGCPDDAISVEPRDEAIGEIRPEMAGRCFVWGIEAKKNIPTHYVETS
jgi:hypothetical protein